ARRSPVAYATKEVTHRQLHAGPSRRVAVRHPYSTQPPVDSKDAIGERFARPREEREASAQQPLTWTPRRADRLHRQLTRFTSIALVQQNESELQKRRRQQSIHRVPWSQVRKQPPGLRPQQDSRTERGIEVARQARRDNAFAAEYLPNRSDRIARGNPRPHVAILGCSEGRIEQPG